MIDILVNMLSPIFVPMGVSIGRPDFLLDHVQKLCLRYPGFNHCTGRDSGRNSFLGKKRNPPYCPLVLCTAFVLAVVLVANLVCFGPLYNNISGALNATSVNLNEDTEQQSKDTIKQVGEEGLVLVKMTDFCLFLRM